MARVARVGGRRSYEHGDPLEPTTNTTPEVMSTSSQRLSSQQQQQQQRVSLTGSPQKQQPTLYDSACVITPTTVDELSREKEALLRIVAIALDPAQRAVMQRAARLWAREPEDWHRQFSPLKKKKRHREVADDMGSESGESADGLVSERVVYEATAWMLSKARTWRKRRLVLVSHATDEKGAPIGPVLRYWSADEETTGRPAGVVLLDGTRPKVLERPGETEAQEFHFLVEDPDHPKESRKLRAASSRERRAWVLHLQSVLGEHAAEVKKMDEEDAELWRMELWLLKTKLNKARDVDDGPEPVTYNKMIHQGWLHSKAEGAGLLDHARTWQRRWCLLVANYVEGGVDVGPVLREYQKVPGDGAAATKAVLLDGCAVYEVQRADRLSVDKEFHFEILTDDNSSEATSDNSKNCHEYYADSQKDREAWGTILLETIEKHKQELRDSDDVTRKRRRDSISMAKRTAHAERNDAQGPPETPFRPHPDDFVVLKGWLKKKGLGSATIFSRHSWKNRYFELLSDHYIDGISVGPALRYFVDDNTREPIAVMTLEGCLPQARAMQDWAQRAQSGFVDKEHFRFDIVPADEEEDTAGPTRELACSSEEERSKWVETILKVLAARAKPTDDQGGAGLFRRQSIRKTRADEARADKGDHAEGDDSFAYEPNILLHKGWLEAKTFIKEELDTRHVWRRRWCLLVGNCILDDVDVGPVLRYYAKPGETTKMANSLVLDQCEIYSVRRDDKPDDSFYLEILDKAKYDDEDDVCHEFKARTLEDRGEWARLLTLAIEDHSHDMKVTGDVNARRRRRESINLARATEKRKSWNAEDDENAVNHHVLEKHPECVLGGWLKKRGSGKSHILSRKSWKRRYFELMNNHYIDGVEIGPALLYFIDDNTKKPIAMIALEGCISSKRAADWTRRAQFGFDERRLHTHFGFDIFDPADPAVPKREISAETDKIRSVWVDAIMKVIADHARTAGPSPLDTPMFARKRMSLSRARQDYSSADADDHGDDDEDEFEDEDTQGYDVLGGIKPNELAHQGWLHNKRVVKQGWKRRKWRRQWSMLISHCFEDGVDLGPVLRNYLKPGENGKQADSFFLDGCEVSEVQRFDKQDDQFFFDVLVHPIGHDRQHEQVECFEFYAETWEERDQWVREIKKRVEDHVKDMDQANTTTRGKRRKSIDHAKRAAAAKRLEEDQVGRVVHGGYLKKKGKAASGFFSRHSWKRRYFELSTNHMVDKVFIGPALVYYLDEEAEDPVACIALDGCEPRSKRPSWARRAKYGFDENKVRAHFGFEIASIFKDPAVPTRALACLTDKDRRQWVEAISKVMNSQASNIPLDDMPTKERRRKSINKARQAEEAADALDHFNEEKSTEGDNEDDPLQWDGDDPPLSPNRSSPAGGPSYFNTGAPPPTTTNQPPTAAPTYRPTTHTPLNTPSPQKKKKKSSGVTIGGVKVKNPFKLSPKKRDKAPSPAK